MIQEEILQLEREARECQWKGDSLQRLVQALSRTGSYKEYLKKYSWNERKHLISPLVELEGLTDRNLFPEEWAEELVASLGEEIAIDLLRDESERLVNLRHECDELMSGQGLRPWLGVSGHYEYTMTAVSLDTHVHWEILCWGPTTRQSASSLILAGRAVPTIVRGEPTLSLERAWRSLKRYLGNGSFLHAVLRAWALNPTATSMYAALSLNGED